MTTKQRQVTIRELMLLMLFFAAGLGGLSTGGLLAFVVIGIAAILTTGIAIVAFVGQQEKRAWAIGFIIPAITYTATILFVGSSELDPYKGRLPTTQFFRPLHRLIMKTAWVDVNTGKIVPDYNPATAPPRSAGGGFGAGGMSILETPDRTTFMWLAHVLLATMFGYAGAKFAVYIHRLAPRDARTGDEQSDPPKSPMGREIES
jgi:hypothetical protein